MDPTATLARIREALANHAENGLSDDETMELVECVEALDDWLSRGGFLPTQWQVPCTK